MGLRLIIGNKNYSSWSLRPWFAMKMAKLDFDETVIQLDVPTTKARIAEHSGAGRVPILRDGKVVIWDSLAILEYLAEAFPEKNLWPAGKAARATARSISSEMHAGFMALRNACPMNLRRKRKKAAMDAAVLADIARIDRIWTSCRETYGKSGKFLFGRFSNADAMYMPVVTRFDTYDIAVSPASRAYMDHMLATPAFREWKEAGLAETWIIDADEVD